MIEINKIRDVDVLTKNSDLEIIKTINSFPIKCHQSVNMDFEFCDLIVTISKSSGIIQLKKIILEEKLYEENHNDAIGKIWNEHNLSFFNFVKEFILNKNICEYGSGSGQIAELALNDIKHWTFVDFNFYNKNDNNKFSYIRKNCSNFFPTTYDVYIHSHFLEHLYEPFDFIKNISQIDIGKFHCFSIPNQKEWLKNNFANALFFEHSVILEEEYIEKIHNSVGFKLIKKHYFNNHSVFYVFEKIKNAFCDVVLDENLFNLNKDLMNGFFTNLEFFINNINAINNNENYNICTAHILTQFLFKLGLDNSKCANIFDNSNLKIGKKLYGYNINIISPKYGDRKLLTIIPPSPYKDEIIENLKELGYERFI